MKIPDLAGTKMPSFSHQVFRRALADTKKFFGSTLKDIILAAVCIGVGFSIYWYFKGWPDALSELASVAAFSIVPMALVVFLVMTWNLWLAPYALATETAFQARDEILNAPRPAAPVAKSPNPYLTGLAGKVRLVAEKAPGYRDPMYSMSLRDITDSSHTIWIDAEMNNLRRQFLHCILAYGQQIGNVEAYQKLQAATDVLAKRLLESARRN